MQPPVPPVFLSRMARLLGEDYAAFLAAYDASPVTGLRANTLKIGADELAARLPFELAPVPWSAEVFVVADDARPGKHPYHAAGLYYLQDPSALAPVILLDPQPGERILDLAAAPGGKATHIAARLRNEGLLVANEVLPKRAWELAGNLERWGARNVVVTTASPERLADHFPGFFDAVLVDAPCSGEGMFLKSASARQDWSPALVAGCASRQGTILRAAAELVRPGGRLVYSTCTFAPEEDEGVVAAFLRQYVDFALAAVEFLPGFSPGRPDWLAEGERWTGLERAVRLWPHTGPGGGHFAALLRREDDSIVPRMPVSRSRHAPKNAATALRGWWQQNMISDQPHEVFVDGSYIYAAPDEDADLSGLRTIHAGWWLGSLKGERFEPSHALALALHARDARDTIDLAADDPAVPAYLRGEVLNDQPGKNGYVLVTVDGYPLGWAKRVGDRLKNLYPKGLRWN